MGESMIPTNDRPRLAGELTLGSVGRISAESDKASDQRTCDSMRNSAAGLPKKQCAQLSALSQAVSSIQWNITLANLRLLIPHAAVIRVAIFAGSVAPSLCPRDAEAICYRNAPSRTMIASTRCSK